MKLRSAGLENMSLFDHLESGIGEVEYFHQLDMLTVELFVECNYYLRVKLSQPIHEDNPPSCPTTFKVNFTTKRYSTEIVFNLTLWIIKTRQFCLYNN